MTAITSVTPRVQWEAQRYADFRVAVFGPGLREDELFDVLPPELELQSRWFAGDFGRSFRTQCGKAVEIVQFGFWNHGAGPDFTNTAVKIGDDVQTGAIELDSDLRDWDHHGHAANPVYNDVVLHLFFTEPHDRMFTKSSANRDIPQVKLRLVDLIDRKEQTKFQPEARIGRCSHPLEEMPVPEIKTLLMAAAQFRLSRKAARLLRIASIHGRDQALFQGFAEAFGYRHNKLPMTILAQRLPLSWLQRNRENAEATLFGLAGFLSGGDFEAFEHETRAYLRGLWESWWPRRAEFESCREPLPRWNLAGVRPSNHPQRRVAALGRIVEHWNTIKQLLEPTTFTSASIQKYLTGIRHEFWDYHYTLAADTGKKRTAIIGTTRVKEILANQIFPVLVHEDSSIWNAYAAQKAELGNEKVRRAALRLFGDHPDAKQFTERLYQQQALLQIYDDFCLADASDCEDCPFPEQLSQWRS